MPFRSVLSGLRASAAGFRREEDGVVTIFGVGVFILMMLAGGIALDFMRFENERAKLQNTLDRAVLAAASLSQERDRAEVIRDYFRASGLGGYTLDIEVQEDVHFRVITAETSAPVRSLFLGMVGIDSITAPASSGASERVLNLEISMVLDVSGSMGNDGKIARLRTAASDFVGEMLADRESLVSIAVVPYNTVVNTGSVLAQEYAHSTAEHALSNCARFAPADFERTDIAAGTVLTRLANFDTFTHNRDEVFGGLRAPLCPHDDTNAIVPWSNDAAALQARIDALEADGNTAIDVGMKWGTALLDPSARGRLNALIGSGDVAPALVDRPADYGHEGTLKIIVLMTDGLNTTQYDLLPERRGPDASRIYAYHPSFAGSGGTRTADHTDTIFDDLESTRYAAWLDGMGAYYDWMRDELIAEPVGGDDAMRLTWHEANSIFGIDYLEEQIVRWEGWRGWIDEDGNQQWNYKYSGYADDTWIPNDDYYFWIRDNDTGFAGNSTANGNLTDICRAARDEGILVYTVAFRAPPDGERAMRECAHEAQFYFDVDDFNIDQALDSIAASIRTLKLTQ